MDGIIVAAGMATRLRPLTNNTPKTLLTINDKPILSYIIDNLFYNGVEKIIIVTGFKEEKIIDYVKKKYDKEKFQFVSNKDYETTNNAYSLLLAKEFVKSDFILIDSDIIFDRKIIKLITSRNDGAILAIKRHRLTDEEIKVVMTEDNKIKAIGKEVPIEKSYGESIGMEYFPYDCARQLFEVLNKRIIKEKRVNEFYEASFQEMIEMGINFYGVDIGKLEAIEIDFKEDFELAERMIKEGKIKTG